MKFSEKRYWLDGGFVISDGFALNSGTQFILFSQTPKRTGIPENVGVYPVDGIERVAGFLHAVVFDTAFKQMILDDMTEENLYDAADLVEEMYPQTIREKTLQEKMLTLLKQLKSAGDDNSVSDLEACVSAFNEAFEDNELADMNFAIRLLSPQALREYLKHDMGVFERIRGEAEEKLSKIPM